MKQKIHPLVILFFGIFLILGLFIVRDYGVSTDEWNNRLNGAVSFKYIYEFISPIKAAADPVLIDIPPLQEFYDRDYGVVFDLPLFAIEWFLGLTGTKDSVFLRHAFIFLLFFLSTIYFYRLLIERFKSTWLAMTGVLFLILCPRIFGHAFFNIKDLAFLSIFLIGFYYLYHFLQSPSYKSAIGFGIISAIAINCRILGVILPFTGILWYLLLWKKESFSRTFFKTTQFKQGLSSILVMAVVTYIIWPYLWENPVIHFLKAFKHMARFRWGGEVKYFGEWVVATKLPWHYIPVWMALTIPILYCLFFFIGAGKIIIQTVREKFKINLDLVPLDTMVLFVFLFPLLTVILLKSVMYGDWRHMYFTYPFFVYLAIIGLETVYNRVKHIRYASYALFTTLLINFILVFSWMFKNHPNQHLYFSFLNPQKAILNFDMDYWTLTNRPAFEYILNKEKDSCYIISTKYDNLFQCNQFLEKPGDTSRYTLLLFKYTDTMTDSLIQALKNKRPTYMLERTAFQLADTSKFRLKEIYPVSVEGNRITSVSEFELKLNR